MSDDVSPGKLMRQAFAAIALKADGVGSTFDHEPEAIGDISVGACVTMLQAKTDPVIVETGGGEDVTREWTVIIYVQLRDYEKAQDDLEDVIEALLSIMRNHQDLDGACDKATLRDDGHQPELHHDHGTLIKVLRLRCESSEIG